MWYVYFLTSKIKRNWLYVGSTNDLKRRIKEHVNGLSNSTAPYLPVYVEGYIAVREEPRARYLEHYLKKGSGKTILKKRILNDEAVA